ncbi:kinesin-like protein KIN-12B [Hibiscus syriacus]|uniref:kinesin-like protein KIN-12B n=1 Tax=Hibiscus syriacus TaxID=106335 RepID=UPI00192054CD|nr:kinesin-like protein KIN-12B [Hibiscus syriacus]
MVQLAINLFFNTLKVHFSFVFAYGQTGSGKTYIIWGPANALFEENLSSDQQGLTPRVQHLFDRINEEQIKHADKHLKYQICYSFLEIYNEKVTDLLDPNQRNLQIREDVKYGVYVENLKEEYVHSMKGLTKLLLKGLSSRRTCVTSINAECSHSHSVLTCVVESRCKSVANGVSYFKTSRINFIDLVGSKRQKLTGAAEERLKEAGNINRSLSQLGERCVLVGAKRVIAGWGENGGLRLGKVGGFQARLDSDRASVFLHLIIFAWNMPQYRGSNLPAQVYGLDAISFPDLIARSNLFLQTGLPTEA